MNFQQIEEALKVRCEQNDSTLTCDWCLGNVRETMSRLNPSGWEQEDIRSPDDNNADLINNIYLWFRRELQMIGMQVSTGSVAHDNALWSELTEVLAALREVLGDGYGVQLPEMKVGSMVDDMVGAGVLERVEGGSDEPCIKIKTDPCDLRIRITKVPEGPAPEDIRAKWVGLELPAFKKSRPAGEGTERVPAEAGNEFYMVPITLGLQALATVSPEGHDWFLRHFGALGNFAFRAQDAEIVA